MLTFLRGMGWTFDSDLCRSSICLQLEVSGLTVSSCLLLAVSQSFWWPNVYGFQLHLIPDQASHYIGHVVLKALQPLCRGRMLTPLPSSLPLVVWPYCEHKPPDRDQQQTKGRKPQQFNLVDWRVWLGLQEYRWRATYRNINDSRITTLPKLPPPPPPA